MIKYLVQYTYRNETETSEWFFEFHELQEFMNDLELKGIVCGVKVCEFSNNIGKKNILGQFKLKNSLTYDFNESDKVWEARGWRILDLQNIGNPVKELKKKETILATIYESDVDN